MYPVGTKIVFKISKQKNAWGTYSGFFNNRIKQGDTAKIVRRNGEGGMLEVLSGAMRGETQYWETKEQFEENWIKLGRILNR